MFSSSCALLLSNRKDVWRLVVGGIFESAKVNVSTKQREVTNGNSPLSSLITALHPLSDWQKVFVRWEKSENSGNLAIATLSNVDFSLLLLVTRNESHSCFIMG